ncbi:MAG: ABC-F family ATP-binding cassette domain-containing protein [Saprospiraceae bacterium]|nr:ABC-F family ATP-binding cassette domain-containing protein [Saprospiraceae bacterium]
MIYLQDLRIQYGDRVLFSDLDCSIGLNDKIGLVGQNGTGKSTLLKIIAGEIEAHNGRVEYPKNISIGYLKQMLDPNTRQCVLEQCLSVFPDILQARQIIQTHDEAEEWTEADHEAMEVWHERGMEKEVQAIKLLKGLGFTQEDLYKPLSQFSGGWQMRVELARLLLEEPEILLLDEPTNHLDIESIIWFEGYLRQFPGGFILISHDKDFLRNTISRTLEIEGGKIEDYRVGYDRYLEEKVQRATIKAAAYQNQQKYIAEKEKVINKFRAKASKAAMAQSMMKQLDRIERIELDEYQDRAFKLRFDPAPRAGAWVLKAEQVGKSYGPKEVLRSVDLTIHRGERVAFVGQNGQGKSTLVKILVKSIPASAGHVEQGHQVALGYYAQDQSDALESSRTILEVIEDAAPESKRTQLRSILGAFLFSGEEVDKRVSVLSGGERARLALACLLTHPINVLVLDEPTNHLDLASKQVLKEALKEYQGALVVVSHDRDFLQGLTEKVIEFRDHEVFEYLGDINYFLEKRNAQDLREVSRSGQDDAGGPVKPKLDYEQRKKLNRQLTYLERDIEKLEEKIQQIELKMTDVAFYEDPGHVKLLSELEDLKGQLKEKWKEWESISQELDEG